MRALPTWIAVAAGGALGTLLRYLLGLTVSRVGTFPWTTLAINVAGSFLLGFLLRAVVVAPLPRAAAVEIGGAVARAPVPVLPSSLFLALTVGLCGGFTTFSTFSAELLDLAERGAWARAWAYATASVALGVGAAFVGAALGRIARSWW